MAPSCGQLKNYNNTTVLDDEMDHLYIDIYLAASVIIFCFLFGHYVF